MEFAGVVMETRTEPVLVRFSAGDVVEGVWNRLTVS
jgi:hypothetical protein